MYSRRKASLSNWNHRAPVSSSSAILNREYFIRSSWVITTYIRVYRYNTESYYYFCKSNYDFPYKWLSQKLQCLIQSCFQLNQLPHHPSIIIRVLIAIHPGVEFLICGTLPAGKSAHSPCFLNNMNTKELQPRSCKALSFRRKLKYSITILGL